MTQHLFRNPIDLFSDVDLTQYGVKFGFEFEMILNGARANGDCGSDRMRAVAPSLMALVGGDVGNYTTEYGGHRGDGYTQWHFTGDGSLDPNDDDDEDDATPLELVSPIFTASEAFDKFSKVSSWANDRSNTSDSLAYTNDSCGLHIGVSADGVQYDQFDGMLFSLLVDDHAVLSHCGRLDNDYANPYYRRFMDTHAQAVRSALNSPDFISTIGRLSRTDHLHGRWSVHASKIRECGYLEYRSPGGDWLSYDLLYMSELIRKIGVAYLAAAGKIQHPMLHSIYNSRMRYALLDGRNPRDSIFPQGATFDIPSIVDSFSSCSISIALPGGVNLHLNGGILNIYPTSRVEPLVRLHDGMPSSRITIRIDRHGSFSSYMTTDHHIRASHINALRWLSKLTAYAADFDASTLRDATRSAISRATPNLTSDQLDESVDRAIAPYIELFVKINDNRRAFSVSQRSSLRAGWSATLSSRVRLRAMSNALVDMSRFLELSSISPSMREMALRIANAAHSAGSPINESTLNQIISTSMYGYSSNPSPNLLARDLRACSVFNSIRCPRTALEFVRSRTMDFIDPELTAAVFSQTTDCTEYVALRGYLGQFVSSGLCSATAEASTRQIRAVMVDVGTSLAASLRRVWAVTGTASALRHKITGAAMRRVLLGSV